VSSHDATFYVQVEPNWSRWTDSHGERSLRGIRAVLLTQNKPAKPRPRVVVTKLTVRVPDAAFLPLRPEVVIVVPEDLVVTSPIEARAEDASE
jgi:hypothetical protein